MSEVESLRKEVEQLRAEIDRVDEWANGLFCVLIDVLPALLRRDPEMAAALAPMWKTSAARFFEVSENAGQADCYEETVERLEARKILYQLFAQLKLWPAKG